MDLTHMPIIHMDATPAQAEAIRRALAAAGITAEIEARDLSAREPVEAALSASENRFRALLQAVPFVAVQGYSLDGTAQYWNDASERIYGYSAQEALGRNLLDLIIPPEMRSGVEQAIQHMAETGQPMPAAELSLMRKDGSRVTVYSSHVLVTNPGRAPELFCFGVDLTDRQRGEERLVKFSEYLLGFGADPLENINRLTALGGELLEADCALYNRLDQGMLCSWGQWHTPPGYNPQDDPEGHICYAVIRQGSAQPFIVRHLLETPYAQSDPNVVPYQLQTYVGQAVKFQNQFVGSLCMVYQRDFVPTKDQQRLIGIIASAIGVEEKRRQAEEALSESETLQRILLTYLPVGVVIVDPVTRAIEQVNNAASAMFGAPEEQIIGQRCHAFLCPAAEGACPICDLGQEVDNADREMLCADGSRRPVLKSVKRIHIRGKEKLLECFVDLTERKQAEAEREHLLAQLQEQAQRIQQVVDTVPTGVLLLDAQGRVLLANPVAAHDLAALAGAQVGEIVTHLGHRPLGELLAPPPAGQWHEVPVGTRTFEIIAKPIGDAPAPENHLPRSSGHWVLVLDDVTELRDQQRYRQVQERLATVGQLAAGIAHDFNNIMGVIVLYAGLLEQAPELSARYQRFVATIRQQADHASKLICQILDFSRRAPMARTALDLLSQTKELVKLLERTLPESIKLNVRYDRNEYIVQADPTRLQQALMNLALNARDALPQGGRLTFTLSALTLAPGQAAPLPDLGPGPWVRLEVADTGSGIAAEHLPRVFEPFFTTKTPGQGTGLGLAQVYGIVKQHDGAIDVTSQVGVGTTFTLYLPLDAAPGAAPASAPAADLPTGRETILLVEDNAAAREAVGETLEALGYRVLAAATGREALATLAEPGHGVTLVLSDIVMPEMGGLELYRRLRVAHPAVKLLFMTGHALAGGGYEELLQAGVPWLQKPFAVAALAARVRAALDGAPDF